MTVASVLLLCAGVLVLLLAFGLIRQARRRPYRFRDLTDLSSGIDPDWERTRRTMRRPGIRRDGDEDSGQTRRPPEQRSS
jgi:hypothetical protein